MKLSLRDIHATVEDLIDLDDPEMDALFHRWDSSDCSTVGICEILLEQVIKLHKEEQGEHYDRDVDDIVTKYGNR